MALRAAAAKGMAIGTIAATVAAALIVIAWPERPTAPVVEADRPGAQIAAPEIHLRAPSIEAPSIEKRAPERARAPVVARAIPVEITALPNAVGSPDAGPDRPGARAVEETPPLASRSIAFVSEPMQVARASIGEVEPPRRGALTRAMGTAAGAFRTAGTSVAGALKKVF
ncbi:MAG: hypothetical protein ACRD1S_14560 [Vicinamibacterales bacterium]